jgi:hypothetical protein
MNINDKSVAFAGELKGQRIGAIGFDLHNSDMPITPEFPIFINNLASYLMDRETIVNYQYYCGDSIEILPLPEVEKVVITSPLLENYEINPDDALKVFNNTADTGIYEIYQQQEKGDSIQLMAINFPISESIIPETAVATTAADQVEVSRGGINIKQWLLMIALAIIVIEWLVYLRINGTRKAEKIKKGGELWV